MVCEDRKNKRRIELPSPDGFWKDVAGGRALDEHPCNGKESKFHICVAQVTFFLPEQWDFVCLREGSLCNLDGLRNFHLALSAALFGSCEIAGARSFLQAQKFTFWRLGKARQVPWAEVSASIEKHTCWKKRWRSSCRGTNFNRRLTRAGSISYIIIHIYIY